MYTGILVTNDQSLQTGYYCKKKSDILVRSMITIISRVRLKIIRIRSCYIHNIQNF